MLGSTFAFTDISSASVGELPDVASHIVTLQLRNNDNFSAEYGLKGTDYDYKVAIRNIRESPKSGQPLLTRHSAEFQLVKRATISAGIVTPAIPYYASVVMRLPETGTTAILLTAACALQYAMLATAGSKMTKMMNFES